MPTKAHYCHDNMHLQGSKSNPEWIIEPCLPVSGIENILDGSKDQQTNFLWRQEWTDAVTGNDGRTPIPAAELGLVSLVYQTLSTILAIQSVLASNTFLR